ncbi:hypothetical protein BDQ17DRAFT_1371068 [Cyathus striatus]|nr:hypothetical protein BDQ17DRAFT_1371068 [Cyathus striatus]
MKTTFQLIAALLAITFVTASPTPKSECLGRPGDILCYGIIVVGDTLLKRQGRDAYQAVENPPSASQQSDAFNHLGRRVAHAQGLSEVYQAAEIPPTVAQQSEIFNHFGGRAPSVPPAYQAAETPPTASQEEIFNKLGGRSVL